MYTIDAITKLVGWLCRKLCRVELQVAVDILQSVLADEHEELKPRNDFKDKHPHYREFTVDPEPPLTDPPPLPEPKPTLDYRQLIAEHEAKTGKKLKPIRRRANSTLPPDGVCCERCQAPSSFLYVNDGKRAEQLRCKVCDLLFPAHRCRRESQAKYFCPCCSWALYRWKQNATCTIYKCPNDDCPRYTQSLAQLNERERQLRKTGMSSQFKLRYQYREFHLQPAQLQTAEPEAPLVQLHRVRKHLSTVGLVLSYSVSFGLSSRQTAQILKRMHGISISHQTVLNYQQAAAVLAHRFTARHLGPLTDQQLAGDETYIRVAGEWAYTWFVIGGDTRAIRAYHLSDNRGAVPAIATLNSAIAELGEDTELPIDFIADGNPSYDAAIHAINQLHGQESAAEDESAQLARHTVIGLKNEDDESTRYRGLKQLIERLNRTYKFHTRARSGFKNQKGAVALTALFVAHYNFLRPHSSLRGQVPIKVPELQQATKLQDQWLTLLHLAGA